MKIVEIIHCCTPGGIENFVKDLLINMQKQNNTNKYELWVLHEVIELFPNSEENMQFEKEYISELKKEGIDVKVFNRNGNNVVDRLKWYKTIRFFLKKEKPDIIHVHSEADTFNICMILLFKKMKIIGTIHNERIKYRRIYKFFLVHKLSKIVSICDKVTESIKLNIKCKDKRIVKIYNGIEIEKFCCERTFDNDSEINIVSMGRLTEQKNHKLLLEAFEILIKRLRKERKKLPNLKIYGEGELKKDLIKYINDNNIQNVQLMGITNNVAKILKESDIYVMSSNYEGFSISLIEAMNSGIAIVCTNVGGNKEIIEGEAGILIENNNLNQLVEALYKLLDKRERKRLYMNCKKKKNKFSIKESAKEHLNLYETIVKE